MERRIGPLSLFALACAAAVSACGGDDSGGSSRAGTLDRSAASVASVPAAAEASLPPLRAARAWLEDDSLLSALANEASRGVILEALAQAAGFELLIGADAGLEQFLSLRVQHETAEVVLARVLAGIPHALSYPADPATGAARLRVVVGVDAASLAAAATPSAERAPRPEPSPEQLAERAERASSMWAQSLDNLRSSDPELRADGARWLNVNSVDGFQAAVERLAEDESPLVRAAAAEALLDADVGAVQPLLAALDDPDPSVVLAALEALEFVGDASTIPHVAPLLKHKDVEVRERTVQAIEFLQ